MTTFNDVTPRMGTLARKKSPGSGLPPLPPKPPPPAEKPIGPRCPSCDTLMRTKDEHGAWACEWCAKFKNAEPAAEAKEPEASPFVAGRRGPKFGSRTNPTCCFKPTKRKSIGSGICVCTVCGKEYDTRKPAAAPSPKPQTSILGEGLGTKEAAKLRADLGVTEQPKPQVTALPETVKAPPPGLNGEHETRREEQLKIPPSRPANNSRGVVTRKFGEFTIYRGEPPARRHGSATTPLGLAIRALEPGEHMELSSDSKTYGAVRSAIHNLQRRNKQHDLQNYLSADGSCRVVRRMTKEESEAAR
jgi:hypothetical protein